MAAAGVVLDVPLPAELEAGEPPEARGLRRDEVRLLVSHVARDSVEHARFRDLPQWLSPGDLLVVNDSATLPAAVLARRGAGGSLRLHVSTMIDAHLWMVEPRAPVAAGETLDLPGSATATMIAPVEARRRRLWYASFRLPMPMYAYLAQYGTPIAYAYLDRGFPLRDYQTFFARNIGSSEMPSAARPFTSGAISSISQLTPCL